MKSAPVSHPNILLVDDNRDGLVARKQFLEELGYRVAVAGTAEEGLTAFEGCAYDVVVADYRMPRMDGVELIARIRKIEPAARVILLSGFVDLMGLNEENTGADVVVAKSSNEVTQLVRSIKRLVNRAPVRKPPGVQRRSVSGVRAKAR